MDLAGESFALVGEVIREPVCADCNRPGSDVGYLIAGRCEACQNERNSAQTFNEANQSDLF